MTSYTTTPPRTISPFHNKTQKIGVYHPTFPKPLSLYPLTESSLLRVSFTFLQMSTGLPHHPYRPEFSDSQGDLPPCKSDRHRDRTPSSRSRMCSTYPDPPPRLLRKENVGPCVCFHPHFYRLQVLPSFLRPRFGFSSLGTTRKRHGSNPTAGVNEP